MQRMERAVWLCAQRLRTEPQSVKKQHSIGEKPGPESSGNLLNFTEAVVVAGFPAAVKK